MKTSVFLVAPFFFAAVSAATLPSSRYLYTEPDYALPAAFGFVAEEDDVHTITSGGCANLAETTCGKGNVDSIDFTRRGFKTTCNVTCLKAKE